MYFQIICLEKIPEILLCDDPNFLNINFYFKSFISEKFYGKYPESSPRSFPLDNLKFLSKSVTLVSLMSHFIWKPMKVPYLFMPNQKSSKIQDKNSKMWMGIQLRSAHGKF